MRYLRAEANSSKIGCVVFLAGIEMSDLSDWIEKHPVVVILGAIATISGGAEVIFGGVSSAYSWMFPTSSPNSLIISGRVLEDLRPVSEDLVARIFWVDESDGIVYPSPERVKLAESSQGNVFQITLDGTPFNELVEHELGMSMAVGYIGLHTDLGDGKFNCDTDSIVALSMPEAAVLYVSGTPDFPSDIEPLEIAHIQERIARIPKGYTLVRFSLPLDDTEDLLASADRFEVGDVQVDMKVNTDFVDRMRLLSGEPSCD